MRPLRTMVLTGLAIFAVNTLHAQGVSSSVQVILVLAIGAVLIVEERLTR